MERVRPTGDDGLRPGQLSDDDITLIARVGAGSFAEVWSARGPDGRRLALKVARDGGASLHHHREAGRVRRVRHPNLVQTYGTTTIGARRCIVMEYVEGRTLQAEFEARAGVSSGLSVGEVLAWAIDLATCLDKLHSYGLAHRDLKPSNLMIEGATRRLVVLDLGLVHDDRLSFHDRTTSGRVMGTVPYMAPEQALGAAVDARADAFAYTTVVFEMLFGARAWVVGTSRTRADVRVPAPGHNNGPFDVTARLVEGQRPRSHGLTARVAAQVDALLDQGWSPRPHERPSSLAQWCVDLAFALRDTPARASLWSTSPGISTLALHTSGVLRDTVDLGSRPELSIRRAG